MTEHTLVQQRIAYALACIEPLKEKGAVLSEYANYVKALPAAIIMNGLGQAAATLKSQAKGKQSGAYPYLYKHLSNWLCNHDNITACPVASYTGYADLLLAITANEEDRYLHAQHEALQMLIWLKKFADAFAPPKKGAANGDTTV